MKDGKTTTEFYFTIAAHVLGTLLVLLGLWFGESHIAVTIVGALVNLLAKLGYDASRTAVKVAGAKAAATITSAGVAPLDPS